MNISDLISQPILMMLATNERFTVKIYTQTMAAVQLQREDTQQRAWVSKKIFMDSYHFSTLLGHTLQPPAWAITRMIWK